MRATKRQQKRAPVSLPNGLNKRLAAYALAATAGLLAGAPAAEATIVYKPFNISGAARSNFSVYSRGSGAIEGFVGFSDAVKVPIVGLGATLDIRDGFDGGCLPTVPGYCDREHMSFAGASLLKGSAAVGSFLVGPSFHSLGIAAAKLASGALISQNRPKAYGGGLLWDMETDPSGASDFGAWLNGGPPRGFLGFIDQGHAGWVGLNFSGFSACLPGFRYPACFGFPGKINVTGYAYETKQGVSIRAGQTSDVPEPGTLGLLALGAIGLAVLRRRQVVAQRS